MRLSIFELFFHSWTEALVNSVIHSCQSLNFLSAQQLNMLLASVFLCETYTLKSCCNAHIRTELVLLPIMEKAIVLKCPYFYLFTKNVSKMAPSYAIMHIKFGYEVKWYNIAFHCGLWREHTELVRLPVKAKVIVLKYQYFCLFTKNVSKMASCYAIIRIKFGRVV